MKLLKLLAGKAATLQQAVRTINKRTQRELRFRGEEVCENLEAFLQYWERLRR